MTLAEPESDRETSRPRDGVGFRSERGPILIALMLSVGLVAIDSTIIATAVPSVVADLGGFAQFPWLFSVYLLAQAVSVPVYSKLADLFGRKPVMLFGIGLFLLGSILCGFAWTMGALIAFRALQGIGAGAIQPMSLTIAGDIYSVAERGRFQGYMASVWAMSAVIGPTLGGVFSEYASWRWIFFVNIPLCLVAGLTLLRNFRERIVRSRHTLDYVGAGLLTGGCTLLILGLLEGGEAWSWASAAGIGVPAAGIVLLIAFVYAERRAAEPVLPLWVFRRRVIVTSSLVSLGIGAVLIGLTSYVPTFVQEALGTGPLVAGFALATLTIGWPITASQSGRVFMRFGFRTTAVIGAALTVVGCVLTALLTGSSTVVAVGVACFVVGAGLGFTASPTLVGLQTTVGWAERGVVTGTNMFSRSVGSAVGVAVFGAIANAVLRDGSSPAAMARATHHVFLGVTVVSVLVLLAVLATPKVPLPPSE
ncbi:MDR family MFS transporter [Hamadaea tsunoensis]|uniref:MDR family MFS transporter n=1 Tax=Hamadaea tsunoensis TaxID=53368 RepID=UPI0004005F71|nr:MDR family MFS transporter [Hamadaea tsunoensis]